MPEMYHYNDGKNDVCVPMHPKLLAHIKRLEAALAAAKSDIESADRIHDTMQAALAAAEKHREVIIDALRDRTRERDDARRALLEAEPLLGDGGMVPDLGPEFDKQMELARQQEQA